MKQSGKRHRPPKPPQRSARGRQQQPRNQAQSMRWLYWLIGGIVLAVVVVGGIYLMPAQETDGQLAWLPTREPTSTPTLTPLPTLEPDTSRRQLLATLQRWSAGQQFGMDCLGAICNQQVIVSFTLLTPEVLTDIVRQELSGRVYTQDEFEQAMNTLERRLQTDEQLIFLMSVAPDAPTAPLRSEFSLGSLAHNLMLHLPNRPAQTPLSLDFVLDQPLPVSGGEPIQGYISFANQDENGQGIVDLTAKNIPSLALQLQIDDALHSDKTALSWHVDFVASPHPDPLAPTPTPDSNAMPTPPLVDKEVLLSVIDLVTELVALQQ